MSMYGHAMGKYDTYLQRIQPHAFFRPEPVVLLQVLRAYIHKPHVSPDGETKVANAMAVALFAV